jgi:hypothetical protein
MVAAGVDSRVPRGPARRAGRVLRFRPHRASGAHPRRLPRGRDRPPATGQLVDPLTDRVVDPAAAVSDTTIGQYVDPWPERSYRRGGSCPRRPSLRWCRRRRQRSRIRRRRRPAISARPPPAPASASTPAAVTPSASGAFPVPASPQQTTSGEARASSARAVSAAGAAVPAPGPLDPVTGSVTTTTELVVDVVDDLIASFGPSNEAPRTRHPTTQPRPAIRVFPARAPEQTRLPLAHHQKRRQHRTTRRPPRAARIPSWIRPRLYPDPRHRAVRLPRPRQGAEGPAGCRPRCLRRWSPTTTRPSTSGFPLGAASALTCGFPTIPEESRSWCRGLGQLTYSVPPYAEERCTWRCYCTLASLTVRATRSARAWG